MEVAVGALVVTAEDVTSDFRDEVIPAGTGGTVVEIYTEPREGYAVDLAIPAPELVGGYRYDNVILEPGQFRLQQLAE